MVRLKGSAQFGRVYGGNKFQFLMVRLKVRLEGVISVKSQYFNSLWCD